MTLGFLWGCQKRIAAVGMLFPSISEPRSQSWWLKGRVEFRAFLVTYFVSLVFQLVTAGALLEQGTRAIGVLTAIHTGIVSAMFWTLLWYAITTTQILDDGGFGSLIVSSWSGFLSNSCTQLRLGNACWTTCILRRDPLYQPWYCFWVYINFRYPFPSPRLIAEYPVVRIDKHMARSVGVLLFVRETLSLFLKTFLSAALGSFLVITYVVVRVLHERRPVYIYFAAAFAFIVAQVFRLSPVGRSICQVRKPSIIVILDETN